MISAPGPVVPKTATGGASIVEVGRGKFRILVLWGSGKFIPRRVFKESCFCATNVLFSRKVKGPWPTWLPVVWALDSWRVRGKEAQTALEYLKGEVFDLLLFITNNLIVSVPLGKR